MHEEFIGVDSVRKTTSGSPASEIRFPPEPMAKRIFQRYREFPGTLLEVQKARQKSVSLGFIWVSQQGRCVKKEHAITPVIAEDDDGLKPDKTRLLVIPLPVESRLQPDLEVNG